MIQSRFVQIGDGRLYRRKGFTRRLRHFVRCTYCKSKVKLLHQHFLKYHPKVFKQWGRIIGKGSVGVINGVRFITTAKPTSAVLHFTKGGELK